MPVEVQWASLVIGIIALVVALMAAPTVLQMIWGSPKIDIDFRVHRVDEVIILRCYITNRPVYSKWLRRLHVSRMPAYIEGTFVIWLEGHPDERFVELARMFSAAGQTESTILLKPSIMPEIVNVIGMDSDGISKILGPDGGQVIDPGTYVFRAVVNAAEQQVSAERKFHVGSHDLHWS